MKKDDRKRMQKKTWDSLILFVYNDTIIQIQKVRGKDKEKERERDGDRKKERDGMKRERYI